MATRTTITEEQLEVLKERIGNYMMYNDMTPAQLSDQCWLSDGIVSRVFRGVSVPSDATIKHLARGMQTTKDALLAPIEREDEDYDASESEVEALEVIGTPASPRWGLQILEALDTDDGIDEDDEPISNPFFTEPPVEPTVFTETPSKNYQPFTTTSFPYYDEEEDGMVDASPYMLITQDTAHYQNGINLGHVNTWHDDKDTRQLVLGFTDGTRMIIGDTQRDIVLAHLRRLNRNLAIA